MPKRTLFSQIPRAHLFRHVVGCAHCECRNCQSWILRATRNETASINNEQIFDIVALVPLIKHAGLGVITHTTASQLMNTFAWRHHLVVLGYDLEAGIVTDLVESIHGITRHVELVIGIASLYVQGRYAPNI